MSSRAPVRLSRNDNLVNVGFEGHCGRKSDIPPRPKCADTVATVFWAANRATLIRRWRQREKEDSIRRPHQQGYCVTHPCSRLLQHYLPRGDVRPVRNREHGWLSVLRVPCP